MVDINENNRAEERVFYISGNSSDRDRIDPIIEELRGKNYPIYYDPMPEDMSAQWRERVSEKIDGCYAVIVFITKGIFTEGSYVLNEYEEAIGLGKVIMPVYLDNIGIRDVQPEYSIYITEFDNLQGLPYMDEDAAATAGRIGNQLEHSSEVMSSFKREADDDPEQTAGKSAGRTGPERRRESPITRRRRRKLIIRGVVALLLVAAAVYAGVFTMKLWNRVNEELGGQSSVSDDNISGEQSETSQDLRVGDTITMGSYPQNSDGGKEPIKWQVLDIKDGKALVISKNVLFSIDHGSKMEWYSTVNSNGEYLFTYRPENSTAWKDSYIRKWLNRLFLYRAFTNEEQNRIAVTTIENPAPVYIRNFDDSAYGGFTVLKKPTQDKLFCLNYIEAETYFKSNRKRTAMPTDYLVADGMERKACDWWLRSGLGVDSDGSVVLDGTKDTIQLVEEYNVYPWQNAGVRPAMWIIISDDTTDEANNE